MGERRNCAERKTRVTGSFLLYLAIGKLLTWLGQKFLVSINLFRSLAECDLCLGVWIFSGLAIALKITILSDVLPHVHILSEIVAGCVSAFIMHILTLGWKTKFDVVVI